MFHENPKMNKRKIYWRRKNKKVIAEGVQKGKTIYLFTLPNPDEFIRRIFPLTKAPLHSRKSSSFFTQEKVSKIMEKITRLDFTKRGDKN